MNALSADKNVHQIFPSKLPVIFSDVQRKWPGSSSADEKHGNSTSGTELPG